VDVITGEGLKEALTGVKTVVDTATGPSPEKDAATQFFVTAARNLQDAAEQARVQRIVVVSIIGCDRFSGGTYGGYYAAKVTQERALLDGPIPAQILRAAQFHEFVGQLLDWATQGDVAYVPALRTQLVAARSVAEALADLATMSDAAEPGSAIPEIAGPRVEKLVDMARLLAAHRGSPAQVEEISDPDDPDRDLLAGNGLLPGPHATLAGPTYEEWLDSHL
jgi:NAD(P)H-binding